MKFLYLLIDLSTLVVPLVFSFHPKIKFYSSWKSLFKAIVLVGIPFLSVDSLFTSIGVWNFNPRYITGIHVFNLPIEEVLFFICIPYSCTFTYYCLDKFFDLSWNPKTENRFCLLLASTLLIAGLTSWEKRYTSTTFFSTAIICLAINYSGWKNWLGKAVGVYGLLLIPFILVNGILTGTGLAEPIVRYNDQQNLGLRLLTIPVEDFFYGFELFILNLWLYFRFSDTK